MFYIKITTTILKKKFQSVEQLVVISRKKSHNLLTKSYFTNIYIFIDWQAF